MSRETTEIQDLKNFDNAYFEGKPIIPDAQYDQLKQELQDKYPNNEYFSEVGATPVRAKVDLPYPMGSLNQVYENDTPDWVSKYKLSNEYVIVTEKLDGISALLIYEKSEDSSDCVLVKAFSRGNGIKGEDITRHVKLIPNVPKTFNGSYAAIRAEIIMPNERFDKKYANKYKNPRNMVAGVINRKVSDQTLLDDLDVVAYEIIDSSGTDDGFEIIDSSDTDGFSKTYTLNYLAECNFIIPRFEPYLGSALTDALLSGILSRFKKGSAYELDGIVLTVDDYSNFENVSKSASLNPEHSVKYKVLDESSVLEAVVVNVHWKISKTGFYKPRVEIEPVELMGSTITYATGFNGKFIYENGIGPGAVIKITKAGSVIPYIMKVTSPVAPKMPRGEWEWDDNRVEAQWDTNRAQNSPEQTFMQVVHFFKSLEVENAQETSLAKVVEAQGLGDKDFTTIAYEIICMLDAEWRRTLGENGIKAYDSLHKKLSNLKHETIMGACPFFGRGFGTRKAKKILEQISYEDFVNGKDISNLEGFNTTVGTIMRGINDFNTLMNKIDFAITFVEKVEDDEQSLAGEKIVMTGFRDKELQEKIEARGGKVASSVSKNTTMVIAQDVNSTSGKVQKAKDLGIPIFSQRDFDSAYIL